jgi:hypothetical protein
VLVATPSVQLTDRSPVTVRVAGFKPHERVRLTVLSGRRWTRTGTTSATGGLVITFPGTRLARCAIYRLEAAGPRGELAWYQSRPAMCVSGD